jgi:DNA-binding SARP family transcriptional activator
MRLYYLSGNRTAALRQYQRCVKTLQEELDVEPALETRKFFELIHDDRLENVQYHHTENMVGETKEKSFNHLSTLQEDLTKIQTLIAKDIQVIQQTLKENQ